MQSTIQIFRHLYEHLPPLFPKEEVQKMKHALEHLEKDQTMTVVEIEDTMIKFGYELWPWNQAYKEFLVLAENEVGEHFLLPRLPAGLQEKYFDFKNYGGTLRDLHSGRPADYFSHKERNDLCVVLVEMQVDLRAYATNKILGLEESKYLRRVMEFGEILNKISIHLENMKALAEAEQDHPSLANEIRSRVRAFEFGLCQLGPELDYEAVCQSTDFFAGRKQELNRFKGVNVPLEIDFYS